MLVRRTRLVRMICFMLPSRARASLSVSRGRLCPARLSVGSRRYSLQLLRKAMPMPRPVVCIVTQVLDDLSPAKYPRCHPTTVLFVTRSTRRARGGLRTRAKRTLTFDHVRRPPCVRRRPSCPARINYAAGTALFSAQEEAYAKGLV